MGERKLVGPSSCSAGKGPLTRGQLVQKKVEISDCEAGFSQARRCVGKRVVSSLVAKQCRLLHVSVPAGQAGWCVNGDSAPDLQGYHRRGESIKATPRKCGLV